MLKANVECWLARLHIAVQGVLMAGHGGSEAAFGCPWDRIWLLGGSIWLLMGSPWLLRDCFWMPFGLHMAAQRVHVAAHGAAYGRSEAPNGCPWGSQRLHLAGEGFHFTAQRLSTAPMQHICSLCRIWRGQAGQQGFQETAKLRVDWRSLTDSLAMYAQDCKMHKSRLKTQACSSTQACWLQDCPDARMQADGKVLTA